MWYNLGNECISRYTVGTLKPIREENMSFGGDSISRYNNNSDRYNVSLTPTQQQAAVQPQEIQRATDTIERIQPQTGNDSQDKAVFAARIGKYVFMAIAAPPYLLLYSVPKWIAQSVAPLLFSQVEFGLKYAKAFFAQVATLFQNFVANFARNVEGKIKWMVSPLFKLNAFLMSYVAKQVSAFTQQVFKASKFVEGVVKEIYEAIEKPLLKLKERTLAKLSKVSKAGQEMAKEVFKATLLPVINWFAERNAQTLKAMQYGMDLIKRLLSPQLKSLQQVSKAIGEGVNAKFRQLSKAIQPAKNYLGNKYQTLHKKVGSALDKGFKKFKHQFKKHQEKAKAIFNVAKSIVDPYLKATGDLLLKLLKLLVRLIRRIFQPFIRWMCKVSPVFVKCAQFIQKSVNNIFNKIGVYKQKQEKTVASASKKLSQIVIGSVSSSFQGVKFVFNKRKVAYVALKRTSWMLVKKGFSLFTLTLKIIGYTTVFTVMVLKYWFQALFALSDDIERWIDKKSPAPLSKAMKK